MSGGFTTADDIAARGYQMCRVNQNDIRRIVTLHSSGSTGAAKRLYFTSGDLERTVDFFRSGMGPICRPGDSAAIMLGSHSPDGLGALLAEGLSRMGVSPALYGSVSDFSDAARFLSKLRPEVIIAAPVPLRRLALTLPTLRPRAVLLSSDYVADSVRACISRLWDTRVFSHYGLTESGLGFAVQCPALSGHHVRGDELFVEIIDPDTGKVLPDGCWGEIVFTTLKREAMPLMRYRTGDISRLISGPCACGHTGQRLDKILGRLPELKQPVNVYILDELLLSCDGIMDYRARFDGHTVEADILGSTDAALDILSKNFGQYELRVSSAGNIVWTGKRHVEYTGYNAAVNGFLP